MNAKAGTRVGPIVKAYTLKQFNSHKKYYAMKAKAGTPQ